ncbi:actin-11-like [Mixophyes fleayi]|uniref:actin-11-like n=1 Tax=Mixophyes fleayi TaxID=3061075 RepID=UPI003F4DA1C8
MSKCPSVSCSSERFKDLASVVIDSGTGFTKLGFSGDEKPQSVLRSVVGVPKIRGQNAPLYYIGDGILQGQSNIYMKNVMTHGVVTDWEALEMMWHHIFYTELRTSPEHLAIHIADAPLSPTTNREKVAELLFENFEVAAMYISHQSLLSMYSYGRISGLVVGTGHGTSYTAPIYDGYVLPHATYRLDVAGDALTGYLAKLMAECGNPFNKDEMGIVCDIKESCCYVSSNTEEIQDDKKKSLVDFILPDGQVISIGNERFRCTEALFAPTILGFPEVGLPSLVIKSVKKCNPEHQATMLSNVVVCGGSSQLRGFPERLKKEMCRQEKGRSPINVIAGPHRRYSAWLGGSIVGSLDSFQELWISREVYDENGPCVVYRRCF